MSMGILPTRTSDVEAYTDRSVDAVPRGLRQPARVGARRSRSCSAGRSSPRRCRRRSRRWSSARPTPQGASDTPSPTARRSSPPRPRADRADPRRILPPRMTTTITAAPRRPARLGARRAWTFAFLDPARRPARRLRPPPDRPDDLAVVPRLVVADAVRVVDGGRPRQLPRPVRRRPGRARLPQRLPQHGGLRRQLDRRSSSRCRSPSACSSTASPSAAAACCAASSSRPTWCR